MKKLIKPSLFKKTTRLPISLRSASGEAYYANIKTRGGTMPLIEEPRLQEWKYWALIENAFPYDSMFKTHHLLIPKRVVSEEELSELERLELRSILRQLNDNYDCSITNFTSKQSIRNHYHIHLLIYKDARSDIKL